MPRWRFSNHPTRFLLLIGEVALMILVRVPVHHDVQPSVDRGKHLLNEDFLLVRGEFIRAKLVHDVQAEAPASHAASL